MNKTLGQRFHQLIQKKKTLTLTQQNNLPLISLNQLETKVNFFKKKKYQKQNIHQEISNNKEINVCSPFYDRMKSHKQNCKCPYHRKKRFSLLPVRHSHKNGQIIHNSLSKKNSHSKDKLPFRLNSKTNLHSRSSNQLNKSLQLHQFSFSQTQPISFYPKIDARNYTYEEFLKQCEYYLLRRKGFSSSKPEHVVRKGVKQIFQFINKHLDYSVDRMTDWVNTIEKDRDYGEFYIQRFKEMKKNYQLGIRQLMGKTKVQGSYSKLFNKTNKSTTQKFRYTHTGLPKTKYQNKIKKNHKDSSKNSDDEQQQSSQDNQENQSESSQISLQKIVKQLKLQNKISNRVCQDLMNMDFSSFKQLFQLLQNNILNQKYPDDLLQKFDTGVLAELIKRYENQNQLQDHQQKMQILLKVHDILKRHRTRRISNISERNSYNMGNNSKGFTGSKRNTQCQNSKTTNSLHTHSKKSSCGDGSHSASQRNLCDLDMDNNEDRDFEAIQEDENELDDESSGNASKILKGLANHAPNVRRSKLLKGQEFKFNDDHTINDSLIDNNTDRDFQVQKSVIEPHKGFFTKVQKYLFDINIGKTIVKKDDSIFTAKRKIRVIKALLKENPNSPEALQLQNYIRSIQQKVLQKTQKDKKPTFFKKLSQIQQLQQDEIWRQISLDTLGYNLIFYNLSSKIRVEDNEDLCILLNELKLNNAKRFDNKVTYKNHLFGEEVNQTKKKRNKGQRDDILVQQDMGNMQFEPEIQSQDQLDLKNQTKRTTKTTRKSLLQLTCLAKDSKISGFFGQSKLELDFDEMDDEDVQTYYEQLKKMFKYARMNLPITYDKYLKSSSIHQNT